MGRRARCPRSRSAARCPPWRPRTRVAARRLPGTRSGRLTRRRRRLAGTRLRSTCRSSFTPARELARVARERREQRQVRVREGLPPARLRRPPSCSPRRQARRGDFVARRKRDAGAAKRRDPTMPQVRSEFLLPARRRPVAALASRHLVGPSAIHAVGGPTWRHRAWVPWSGQPR